MSLSGRNYGTCITHTRDARRATAHATLSLSAQRMLQRTDADRRGPGAGRAVASHATIPASAYVVRCHTSPSRLEKAPLDEGGRAYAEPGRLLAAAELGRSMPVGCAWRAVPAEAGLLTPAEAGRTLAVVVTVEPSEPR